MAIGTSLHSIDNNYVKPRIALDAKYYLNNTRPQYNDALIDFNNPTRVYLAVRSTYTIFGVMDLNVGMQGWAIRTGFQGGRGGGIWGVDIRITDNLTVGYEHFSCHVFDRNYRCGSEDSIKLRFHIGYDNNGYSSLSHKIKKLF